jgi:hypothetical protein
MELEKLYEWMIHQESKKCTAISWGVRKNLALADDKRRNKCVRTVWS